MHAKKKSEYKLAIREQARRKVGRITKYDMVSRTDHKTRVEQGLKELRRVSAEGGDSRAKKIKNELTYLLSNYLPQYDVRIEALIDEWRRSGDPAYDPEVRGKLRRARQEHMRDSHPA